MDVKYNRMTNAEDNKCQPVFWQTPCYAFAPLLDVSNEVSCVPLNVVEKQSCFLCVEFLFHLYNYLSFCTTCFNIRHCFVGLLKWKHFVYNRFYDTSINKRSNFC